MPESDLYLPVKKLLQARGFDVKAEVQSCDVVARRGDEAPLIVELKQAMSLQLIYQAVDRLALTDNVYVAVARPKRGLPSEAVKLCRRLGLGLMVVSVSGAVEVMAEPGPYAPRIARARQLRVMKEFERRRGDPNVGGVGGVKLMTAYKQDALLCLQHLHKAGPTKLAVLRAATKVDRVANILRDNHYGWFARTQVRGVYHMTVAGQGALLEFDAQISLLVAA